MMDMEKLKRAVEIEKKFSDAFENKYFGALPSTGELAEARKTLLDLAHSILSSKGMPERIKPDNRITKLDEVSFNKGRIVGHNSLLDLVAPYVAKLEARIAELEGALKEVLFEAQDNGVDMKEG